MYPYYGHYGSAAEAQTLGVRNDNSNSGSFAHISRLSKTRRRLTQRVLEPPLCSCLPVDPRSDGFDLAREA